MRPLRIRATNCKAYKDLDLDVSGIRYAVIVGPNGSGKSLLVDLVKIGLFDKGRLGDRALAGLIGQWGDTASITLDFEHGGRTWRVTRTRRNTGKTRSRTDVVQETTSGEAVTTSLTVEEILGVSADTLGATTFLRSRGSDGLGDFGSAKPEARRAMLYELRRANRYKGFVTKAKEAAAAARRAIETARRQIEWLDDQRKTAEADVAASQEAKIAAMRERLDAAELAFSELRTAKLAEEAKAKAFRTASADAATAKSDVFGAARALKAAEDRVEMHRITLSNAEAVRAAVTRRAELEVLWRETTAKRNAALEAKHAASVALTAARREMQDALDHNVKVAARDGLVAELARVQSDHATKRALGELGARLTALRETRDRVAKRDSLQSDLTAGQAQIDALQPVLEIMKRADSLRAGIATEERWTKDLDTVPCKGEGEYAACSYLAAAVAARERLAPLRAQCEEALAALASTNVTDGVAAVEATLAAARRQVATATGGLASLAGLTANVAELDSEIAGVEAKLAGAVPPSEAELRVLASQEATLAGRVAAAPTGELVDVPAVSSAAFDEATRELASLEGALESLKPEGERLKPLVAQAAAVEAAGGAMAAEEAALPALRATLAAAEARLQAATATESTLRAELAALAAGDTTTAERNIATIRREISAAEVTVAAAAAARDRLTGLAAQLAAADAEAKAAARDLAIATTATRFYEEAPAIIIENDRTAIERAVNDWLSRTSAMSVELVLQRPQKGDSTKLDETLDVDVIRPCGRDVRETCSAGELFRVDIGLAIGIGQTIGVGRSWMVIDEGFGTLKQDVLVSVARELGQVLSDLDGLWIVEHNPLIIDQFPIKLVVSPGPQGSTVTVEG